MVFFKDFEAGKRHWNNRKRSNSERTKELLSKIVGRWITQTNIRERNGQVASKVINTIK